MPLTEKGETIKKAMQEEYGEEKGERVMYASKNAGKITGIDATIGENPPGSRTWTGGTQRGIESPPQANATASELGNPGKTGADQTPPPTLPAATMMAPAQSTSILPTPSTTNLAGDREVASVRDLARAAGAR
jgi:hypothetical protein